MLKLRRNIGFLYFLVKRYISDCSFKGVKHYEYFIRHIRTDLNNRSYLVKQTTAIPKDICKLSRDIPYTIGPQTSYNSFLPSIGHSKFKISNEPTNRFLEKNVLIQDAVNKMVTHYSTKENNSNSIHCNHDIPSCHIKVSAQRDETFSKDNNDESNYHESFLYHNQRNKNTSSYPDDPNANDCNSFSLNKIKELMRKKFKDLAMADFKTNNILSDDIVILNQKIPERESLLFFKNKDLHVIESSHTNFKNEVKHYIKKIDTEGRNRSEPERLNVIRFSKVHSSDDSYFSKNNSSDLINTNEEWSLNDNTTLRVKKSVPLEQNAEKYWISFEENSNNEINRNNFENAASQSYIGFSPTSGPPFTQNVPINKDKLIEENVVPNTSILNIINSIDKSAVIIQKDLYITDQVIQKIQKEEENNKETDKNKLETSGKKGYIMYLGAPFIKDGMVTLSLTGLTAGIKEVSLNNKHEDLNNSNDNKSLITREKSTEEDNYISQQETLSKIENTDVNQTRRNEYYNNEHNLPASVTVNSIDNGGKIALNMLYEPNNVVPMFSFLSKNKILEGAEPIIITNTSDNIVESNNNLLGQSEISQPHHPRSENEFENNNEKEKIISLNESNAQNPQIQSSEWNYNNVNLESISKVSQQNEKKSQGHKCSSKHRPITKLKDKSYKPSSKKKNRLQLVEKEFMQQRTITSKSAKKPTKTFKEEPRYTIPDNNRPMKNKLKDYIPHKKIYIYDSTTVSPGEGLPVDIYVNQCNSATDMHNIEDQPSDSSSPLGNSMTSKFPTAVKKASETFSEDHSMNKETTNSEMNSSGKVMAIDNINNPYNSTPTSQDKNYKVLVFSNEKIKKLENELSKLKKHNKESGKFSSSQPLSDIEKSLETLIKEYILMKETSVFNDLKNGPEKQYSETPKEELSLTAQNIVESLETLLKDNNLKSKYVSASNDLKNESAKNHSETPKEADYLTQHIVKVVKESLETWLKDNIPKKVISASDGLNSEYKPKYSEEPSHLNHNTEEDFEESEKKLPKDFFPKTEAFVSNVKPSDKEVLTDHHVNLDDTEYKNYHSPNTIDNELEFIENDFPKHEELTNDLKKKYSEFSEEEPFHNAEQLPKEETSSSNTNYPVEGHGGFFNLNNYETNAKDKKVQSKNKILGNKSDIKLSTDPTIQKFNNQFQYTYPVRIPQLHSLKASNESKNKSITNKEGSYHKKREQFFNMDLIEKENEVKVPFKNKTDSNLTTIASNETNQSQLMKRNDLVPELSSISSNSGKNSFSEKKNLEKLNKFIPFKKKLEGSNTNVSSVDRIKKTTISSIEKNNFTDIKVSEVETYVDSRLPVPFSTETFFQIFGSNHSLRDHSSFIDVAKYKLTSKSKITDQHSNLCVMAKLDDIHKSVQYLNFLAMNSKSLESKNTSLEKKTLAPSKEISKSFTYNQGSAKSLEEQKQNIKNETPKNKKEKTINEENVSNFLPKFSKNIFKSNNMSVKANNLKQMSKNNLEIQKNLSEIKKQDQKTSPAKDEKSLLVVETKNDNIKEIKIDKKKRGIQKPELTGIKVSKGKYVDLFSFNKKEKKTEVQGHKKGIFDHRALSKRDRKILREITKEVPKQKSKGKSRRNRPLRPITSRKHKNEIQQSTKSLAKKPKRATSKLKLPKKDSESAEKPLLPNTHLSDKQKLLPAGKHGQEKAYKDKIENVSQNIIPRRGKKPIENKNLSKSEGRKSKDIKLDKIDQYVEKIKITETKSPKDERLNIPKTGSPKQITKSEKISYKYAETRNSTNDGGNIDKVSKKPLCQTYVATETYINQLEKAHTIPEKIFTSKKIIKKHTIPQKVTIVENTITSKEDNTLKIQEGFKEDLIKKSQNKIENRSNIDFRVKTPKIRHQKPTVTTSKSKKKEVGPATVFETKPVLRSDKQKSDFKSKQPVTQKQTQSDHASTKEIKATKKTNITKKAALVQNIKNEELKVNQSIPHSKEKFSQPKTKTKEAINNKHFEKMATEMKKPHENEQMKIVATDKPKSPTEQKSDKSTPQIGLSQNVKKKHFPMFLIDVDKMSKEIKPELDFRNCQQCQVALDKITEFPLHNQEKKLLFKPPFKIINLGPSNNPTLRDELKLFPSVTKVLNSTIPENSREVLREWRKSMIDELGENGFKSFYKGQLIDGNKFNWQLHNFLLNGDIYKKESDNLSLKSIENVLRKTSDLSAVNSHVIHRKLAYRGVIDCVAKYQHKPVLIEWKRLENPRVEIANSSIDVAATQLSAYIGALNYDDTYKFQVSGGLIVLAFNDGSQAEVIEINNEQCNKHWKMWLRRLQTYHESSRKKAK